MLKEREYTTCPCVRHTLEEEGLIVQEVGILPVFLILVSCLASTVGNFQARFQFPSGIHETPFIFPFFTVFVELLLPRLVECFKPVGSARVLED